MEMSKLLTVVLYLTLIIGPIILAAILTYFGINMLFIYKGKKSSERFEENSTSCLVIAIILFVLSLIYLAFAIAYLFGYDFLSVDSPNISQNFAMVIYLTVGPLLGVSFTYKAVVLCKQWKGERTTQKLVLFIVFLVFAIIFDFAVLLEFIFFLIYINAFITSAL